MGLADGVGQMDGGPTLRGREKGDERREGKREKKREDRRVSPTVMWTSRQYLTTILTPFNYFNGISYDRG